jgi:hypothetical protein
LTIDVLELPSQPTLTAIDPSAASVGSQVTIIGTGFVDGATAVAFSENKLASNVSVDNDTTLRAIVPPEAVSGPVTVRTPGGSSGAAEFEVD